MKVLDDFAMDFIAERRSNVEKGLHTPTSDHCVAGRHNNNSSHDDYENFDILSKYIEYARKEDEDISDRDLRDIVVNVMFAGEFKISSQPSDF